MGYEGSVELLVSPQFGAVQLLILRYIGCPYMTAIMLLIANNIHEPQHTMWSVDSDLVRDGLHLVGKMSEKTQHAGLQSFLSTCLEFLDIGEQKTHNLSVARPGTSCAQLAAFNNSVTIT